jgi:hypothetical protein
MRAVFPFGRWVRVDRFPEEPLIGFVYLDQRAGPSVKGGLASEPNLARMPSRTIRLAPDTKLTPLTSDEARAQHLPARPEWLGGFGKQPDPDAPWRTDPLLAPRLHTVHPDDTQAYVHDGDPRRTRRGPELCWVRLVRVARAEPPAVYVGELLNAPHTLTTVARGDLLKLVSAPGLPHLLHVTDEYLRERSHWEITPCNKCGASECFDPPSVMAKVRFPDAPAGVQMHGFTSFCSICGGVQQLTRRD